jgi:hypothetical protein
MSNWEQDEEETHFLNVDVDVWSRSRLEPLVDALGKRVLVHHVGREGKRHGAHFSLTYSGDKDADQLTRELAILVTKLPREARRLWDQAHSRDFNVGIQAGIKPHSSEIGITPETLELVAKVRGRVVVTTYAVEIQSLSKPLRRTSRPPDAALQRTRRAPAKKPRR